jgi:hypothetical protein
LAEYKKEITVAVSIAVALAIIVGGVSTYYFSGPTNPAGTSSVTTSSVHSTETATSVQFQMTTNSQSPQLQLNDFSVLGKIPILVVTPQNNTFLLMYNVTSYNYTLSLSYEQVNSYSVQYSNGTQWLNSSRDCQTTVNNSTTTIRDSLSNSTVVTTTGVPCGKPNGEWYPVNGEPIANVQNFNGSDVQVSIQPTSVPAHTTQTIQVRISIEMDPGVYAINLAVGIQAQGFSAVEYSLGYTPVIVQS